jgi:hypothetical protein
MTDRSLEKLRSKLGVLDTLNDAFQTAMDDPVTDEATRTALIQWRMPLRNILANWRAQEAALKRRRS